MKYVVKRGAKYATGARTWTAKQREAFVFNDADNNFPFDDAYELARAHAGTFHGARVVRLVPKRVEAIGEEDTSC